ncbi:MAG: response regulator [Phycisphaerae bacterium]|nr:response regulator [Phycisphaerae bacterium]
MTWHVALDAVALAGIVVAVVAVLRMRARRAGGVVRWLLLATLAAYLFIAGANTVEHLGLTDALDPFEDYAEILFFPFALFSLYALWVQQELLRRTQAERLAEHLNQVLRSIQQINQLIVREVDRQSLLTQSCSILVESPSFSGAWAVLLDDGRRVTISAEAGATEQLRRVAEAIDQGRLPECIERALGAQATVRIAAADRCPPDPGATDAICSSCGVTLVTRIGHAGHAYGVLAVSHEARDPLAADAEKAEAELLGELADDLGLALHKLALEHEKEEAEAQFRQAQKMEAVGRLAGGLAHDLRNQLTVINGYSDLLLPEAPAEGLWREGLEEIRKAAQGSEHLVRRLLAFSRKQELHPEVLDVGELLRELQKTVSKTVREDVQVSVHAAEDLGRIEADRGQLDQALINLVINAQDAMPNGGTLAIEASNVDLDASCGEAHQEMRAGPHVLIAVSDTGVGMDHATREHCFDPFFTTKEVGKGTGLGLSMVHGFVRQSGGAVYVYSEPGLGTTFKLYMPRVDKQKTPPQAAQAVEPRPGGTETILVVEDEESVRRLAVSVLRRCGYTVMGACGADEAVALFRGASAGPHLLLTDVIMPSVSGPELADRLTAEQPDLKVLYMSGYSGPSADRHIAGRRPADLLPKPFSPDQLARAVRRALDGPVSTSHL